MLRLLRGNLTIREIGNELYISYNTAKGYTKTIYQKLGVNSRVAAIAAASAANLSQGTLRTGDNTAAWEPLFQNVMASAQAIEPVRMLRTFTNGCGG